MMRRIRRREEELAMFRTTCRTTLAAAFAAVASIGGAMGARAQTPEWYRPTGSTCSTTDVSKSASVKIKADKYDPKTMISPDSAKLIALCAVPGQVGSGEMNVDNGITEYAIDIIPNQKKTHAKVIVDARTGAVLSSKQFGGLRGVAGWVRESAEHKKNSKP
jgi:uncharacterized membrane protein YkoI